MGGTVGWFCCSRFPLLLSLCALARVLLVQLFPPLDLDRWAVQVDLLRRGECF